ncbi:glycosyltransferase family 4 protein [Pedobacter sp. PAMC26386]|nr:glycosyltransferase family 4 protein [Pedobacter sp. PAMC26386]
MTRILLDPEIFILQEFGGISRYYTEIYSALDCEPQVQIICPILYTNNIHFKESSLFKKKHQTPLQFLMRNLKFSREFLSRKLRKRSKKRSKEQTISLLKKQDFEVYIPTYYDPYFLAYIQDKPYILTVYDMIHELYPHYFLDDQYTVPHKKLLIEKAAKVIAISESTKRDILKVYPHISPEKIEIVYLAHTIKTTSKTEINVPENYILFVGNRSAYKNFTFFLKAISGILKEKKDLFLLCAGGNTFNTDEIQLIDSLELTNQVIQRKFQDAELPAYYKKANCFVFPSEYEGFGIPVLEAMACSCPVVLANHSSFPEVAGEAGVYFELSNATDLKDKVKNLLDNIEIRKMYIQKGLEQAAKFNWKKTTDECLKIYQSVS